MCEPVSRAFAITHNDRCKPIHVTLHILQLLRQDTHFSNAESTQVTGHAPQSQLAWSILLVSLFSVFTWARDAGWVGQGPRPLISFAIFVIGQFLGCSAYLHWRRQNRRGRLQSVEKGFQGDWDTCFYQGDFSTLMRFYIAAHTQIVGGKSTCQLPWPHVLKLSIGSRSVWIAQGFAYLIGGVIMSIRSIGCRLLPCCKNLSIERSEYLTYIQAVQATLMFYKWLICLPIDLVCLVLSWNFCIEQVKPTDATYRVRDPAEVRVFLERLVRWGRGAENAWHKEGSCKGWALNTESLPSLNTSAADGQTGVFLLFQYFSESRGRLCLHAAPTGELSSPCMFSTTCCHTFLLKAYFQYLCWCL